MKCPCGDLHPRFLVAVGGGVGRLVFLKERNIVFTGIVEETGVVGSFTQRPEAWRLRLAADAVSAVSIGDSVAVNGCCLTVVERDGKEIAFDLLEETVRVTSFAGLRAGLRVNLERSLPVDGRLGGHFVSAHVDGTGKIMVCERRGADLYMEIEPPPEFLKYLVYKGSIAVDGISLTVAEVLSARFSIWLIPHTLDVTNLGERKVGDLVNLEFDLLAKYTERLLREGSNAGFSR